MIKQQLKRQQQQLKKHTDMKKVILFAAILFSSISIINVQAQALKSGEAKLTLNLAAVQSIVVDGDVIISYESISDYADGKDGDIPTKLTVTSAGGFVVKAEAKTDLTDGDKIISVNTISITAKGLTNTESSTFAQDATLGKVGDGKPALITSTKGGADKQYSVSYKGKGSNAYLENYDQGGRSYTTTVVYTVSAS